MDLQNSMHARTKALIKQTLNPQQLQSGSSRLILAVLQDVSHVLDQAVR